MLYLDELISSEVIEYINDIGIHCIVEVYVLKDMIKAFAFLHEDEDEEIVGYGVHSSDKYKAVDEAIRDLVVIQNKNRLN